MRDVAIRLEWLYAKASWERWDEETKLLKAEGERVGTSFEWLKNEWSHRREAWTLDEAVSPEAVAYAARTMATVGRLEKKITPTLCRVIVLRCTILNSHA
ncbi:hypothetical protein M422DRAFT_267429 [Sphaerobolus stellatus SS14]|uniref:Uncharacterized protein n=1 Tax=Sphaerobolus stellatus (strain SS14) TaxID=990650 RepID=A0A0C9UPT6_SPHS4|nr:hypothetical protein M422DRAFT_267429 [Sphaerobolus stellatus SS14]